MTRRLLASIFILPTGRCSLPSGAKRVSAPVSLYEPVYADGGDAVCVMDQIRDDHSSDEGWLQQLALKDAISHLQPRERNILALRFCQGKTQMEVSSEIGISQAQVSRLEKNAIRSIKQEL